MGLDGVETFVIKHRLYKPTRCRIAVHCGDYVGAESFAECRLVPKGVVIGLSNKVSRNVGVGEPLAHPMRDYGFERVMMKNVLVDEGGELGLAARHVLSFATDARADWMDLVEAPCGARLKLSHGPLSPGTRNLHMLFYHSFASAKSGCCGALRMPHARWLSKSITPSLKT